jgi:hypothetical protein
MAGNTEKEREQLRDLRYLSQLAERHGISVRRENLARGHSFRVKSGECVFGGESLVFVDKRLSVEQQLSVLTDFLIDNRINLEESDVEQVSTATRALFMAQQRPQQIELADTPSA